VLTPVLVPSISSMIWRERSLASSEVFGSTLGV
jgi:hypothetical protein